MVMPAESLLTSPESLLDRLAESYQRVEQHLSEYRAALGSGQFGGEALQRMYREVERSAELLAAFSSALSDSTDMPATRSTVLADKKQQVLHLLSRALQSLNEAEQLTEQHCSGLNRQLTGLHQAENLYRAYATALATLTSADHSDTAPLAQATEPTPTATQAIGPYASAEQHQADNQNDPGYIASV
jgi:hypothetical protein